MQLGKMSVKKTKTCSYVWCLYSESIMYSASVYLVLRISVDYELNE